MRRKVKSTPAQLCSRLSKLLFAVVLIASASNLSAQSSSAGVCGDAADIGGNAVELMEVRYDFPTAGESTWFYQVTSNSEEGIKRFQFKMASDCHLMKDFPNNVGTYDLSLGTMSPADGKPKVKVNNKKGTRKIMFNRKFKEPGARGYYITFDQNYKVGEITTTVFTSKVDKLTDSICGPDSTCAVFCTDVCAYPRSLKAEVDSDTSVLITWDKLTCHKSYRLCGFSDDGSFSGCRQVTGNSVHFKYLRPNKTYNLYMRSNCKSIGNSGWSDTITFVTEAVTTSERLANLNSFEQWETISMNNARTAASNEMELQNGMALGLASINVFPNPARNLINVQLQGLDSEWTLSNYTGAVYASGVTTNEQQNLQIDAADFPTGIYFLQFSTAAASQSIRVLLTD